MLDPPRIHRAGIAIVGWLGVLLFERVPSGVVLSNAGRALLPFAECGGSDPLGVETDLLRAAGAEPVICDALDAAALDSAVQAARPDAVVNQLTALLARISPRRLAPREQIVEIAASLCWQGLARLTGQLPGGNDSAAAGTAIE
jgi:hypothetical protein